MTGPREYDEPTVLARIEAVYFESPDWLTPPEEPAEEAESYGDMSEAA